jgi:DNA polymerase-3 subunit alpha
MKKFVHLRCHSEYSITDGVIKIDHLVEYAKKFKMPALALTDLNNLFAFVKFYSKCRENGIKPILGSELNVIDSKGNKFRLIILVKNNNGFIQLNELITRSYTDNKIFDIPYVREEWLLESNDLSDILVLSGGVYGDIVQLIKNKHYDEAINKLNIWKNKYGNNYFLELHNLENSESTEFIIKTLELSSKLNIPVVATHPIQFLDKKSYLAHELRVCIANSDTLDNPNRKTIYNQNQYFKSIDEMYELFPNFNIALENSLKISQLCNVELVLGKYFLPDFKTFDNLSINDYITKKAYDGLQLRIEEIFKTDYNNELLNIYKNRLELEIDMIIKMGFAGYFLIVADFINWAKENNVPVGPGRGSGAGSLVAFSLKITDIDPIKYGLLFERFLNPERVSMPDFDIDFCQEKREKVIDYVKQKYGEESVAQIATFGTMSSKAVIKDVGRALGLPYGLCDSISKLILNTPAKSYGLLEAFEFFPDLKSKIVNGDEDIDRLWGMSLQLEDLVRNVGKHAAGVLIAPTSLTNYCPLYVADGMQTSQLDKDDVEKVGLVKFDFLGLRNLTIIQESIENIKIFFNKDIKLSQYDFNDPKVYQLLQEANTSAVFQLESKGMKRVLTKLAPDCFEDIIAMLALYRPGPLGSGMVDDFIKRKKGEEIVNYFHDDLKDILQSTYGVIVYQEQVMQISQVIGGYTLGGADLLRRAMGKKKPEEMAKHRIVFIEGAIKRGYEKTLAEELFDLMAMFAEYGFNKSHSAAYAVISYHTAYLKAHYLTSFMAATLSSELDNTDKLFEFYQDLKLNKITLLPPDINLSYYKFIPVSNNEIRYALGAIKGIGQNIVELIVHEREQNGFYLDVVDFCSRIDKKVINKKTIESLIKSGAFDSLESNRAKLFNAIPHLLTLNFNSNEQQVSLFDDFEDSISAPIMIKEHSYWDTKELLQYEKQALGFYYSANLFDQYKDLINQIGLSKLSYYNIDNEEVINLLHNKDKTMVNVAGIITNIGSRPLKKGGKLYFINIEDDLSNLEFILYNNEYEEYQKYINIDNFIVVEGELMYDSFRDQIKVIAKKIYTIDELLINKVKKVTIKINQNIEIEEVKKIVQINNNTGVHVLFSYNNQNAECLVKIDDNYKFDLSLDSINKLKQIKGVLDIIFVI